MKYLTILAVGAAAMLPATAFAQDAPALPRAMFVSQWQCPQGDIQGIMAAYDSITRPIEQELVNEGLMYGAGMFFHNWGDEWNVNWYRLGNDNAQVFAAMQEVGNRLQARHPNAPNRFASCTAHKDNIYFWGPRTTPPPMP